jgi:hypothetical protein
VDPDLTELAKEKAPPLGFEEEGITANIKAKCKDHSWIS